MSVVNIFEGITVLTLLVYFVPVRWKQPLCLVLSLGLAFITTTWAIQSFTSEAVKQELSMPFWFHNSVLVIDKLTAFFLVVINFGTLTSILFSRGYMKMYEATKRSQDFSLHYFFLLWLQIAMTLVVTLQEGLPFLVAWEIMSLSSFMLVIFESEKKEILNTGIYYLIQMHVALFFVLAAFALVEAKTGISGFDGLAIYFKTYPSIPMFLLFFAGFGIKAGFIPLHSWLPHAHPAAPSHISGIMSGTMIKMGIYGILRVVSFLHESLMEIGTIVLIVSLISSVFGVFFAIFQHDLKKMLAYHSIENIGIIGIGIGTGLIGKAIGNPIICLLGFSGAILHVLNHSLFKSLLFYCAGSVYNQCHTRDINELGGLIKKMPATSMLFLLASIAICGLPPFNGFISEFLIYKGFFSGLDKNIFISLLFLGGIMGLTITGGLAVFCFTKAFGVAFLGAARTNKTNQAHEVPSSMLLPKFLIAIPIVAIGIASFTLMPFIEKIAIMYLPSGTGAPVNLIGPILQPLSIALGLFILLLVVLFTWRSFQQKSIVVTTGPTWGCGYPALTPQHQYTSTTFADNLRNLSMSLSGMKTHYHPIKSEDIFPAEQRKYETHQEDELEKVLILQPSKLLLAVMLKFTFLRSGKIQHYILYGLGFILMVALLTIVNAL
jgi:formate hydrogenlyase subunit 3/multisubunit Na+/H+ antiporter MnhD subunit